MKTIIFILKKIWGFWFGIWFLGVYFILFPFYFIVLQFPGKKSRNIVYHINSLWGYIIMTMALVFVIRKKNARLTPGKTYIFVANHRSWMDIPIMHATVRTFPFRFIGKSKFNAIPLFGYMYSRAHIQVNYSSKEDRSKSLLLGKKALLDGERLCMFAEGTSKIKTNHCLAPFKDGAFKLSCISGVPIVPITIIGSNKALSNDGKFLMQPFTFITSIINEPIVPREDTAEEAEYIKNKCRDVINKQLAEYYPNPNE